MRIERVEPKSPYSLYEAVEIAFKALNELYNRQYIKERIWDITDLNQKTCIIEISKEDLDRLIKEHQMDL
jgi:hypothetical protein